MIRASWEEVRALCNGWRERRLWVDAFIIFFRSEGGTEEHSLWVLIEELSETELCVAGENAVVCIPLRDCIFEYSEIGEAPEQLKAPRFSRFDFCLAIRSQTVSAYFFGARPQIE